MILVAKRRKRTGLRVRRTARSLGLGDVTVATGPKQRRGIDYIPNNKEIVRRQSTYSGIDVDNVLPWSEDIGGREEIQTHRARKEGRLHVFNHLATEPGTSSRPTFSMPRVQYPLPSSNFAVTFFSSSDRTVDVWSTRRVNLTLPCPTSVLGPPSWPL